MTKTQRNHIFWYIYAIAAVFFVVYSVICFYPINLEPTQATWSIPSTMPSGMRYSGSTYYASTPQEFLYAISRPSSITIELVDNIDFSGNTYPTITKSTSVTINGNGYTILGVDINVAYTNVGYASGYYGGLISLSTSTSTSTETIKINNVHLEVDIDHTVSNAGNIGGFVGYARGTVTINNCTVNGGIDVTRSAIHYVGGFVGYSSSTININNSINYADINTIGATQVGGLIGHANSTSTTLSVCANFGDIKGATGYVGGLVGYSQGNQTLSTNFNSGNITGTTGRIGGLVGYTTNTFTISNCYNSGDFSNSVNNTNVGGLVGEAYQTLTLNNCFSIGNYKRNIASYSNMDNVIIAEYLNYTQRYSISNGSFPIFDLFGAGDGGGVTDDGEIIYSSYRIELASIKVMNTISLNGYEFLVGNSNLIEEDDQNNYMYASFSTGNLFECSIYVDKNGEKNRTGSIKIDQNKDFIFDSLTGENVRDILNSNDGFPSNSLITDAVDVGDDVFMFDGDKQMDITIGSKVYEDISKQNSINVSGGFSISWNPVLYGLKLNISGNSLSAIPIGYYVLSRSINNGLDMEYKRYSFTFGNDRINLNLPSFNVSNYLADKSEIKNKSLDSEYIKDPNINNGYPILKDFYWMYS